MLSDETNLGVILHRVQGVAILQRESIAMVHVDVAVWHIVHEQAPEQISCHHGATQVLSTLNDAVKGLQRRRFRIIRRPVVLAHQVDLVRALHEGDVLLQLGVVGRVVMVGKDVDVGYVEVSLVHAVGAVHDELVRRQFLDERGDFGCPGHGDVLIAEDGAAKLVSCFVTDDGGVLGVCEAGVGVPVGEEVGDVVLEVLDDGWVGVEFLDKGVDFRGVTGRDGDSSESRYKHVKFLYDNFCRLSSVCVPEKVEFTPVVVVLGMLKLEGSMRQWR